MMLKYLRTLTLCTAAAATPFALLAQQPAGSPPSTDKIFLHRASMGGYAEVQFGQLAAQKGNSDEVKKFGQKMVDDHTALNDQMKPFVESAGLLPPTKLSPKDQAEYDKLNGLSGDAFDKEYLAFMVKDHHQDLREFRHEESMTTDSSLTDAVAKGTAVIKEHMELVDKLAKDKGVAVPMHHSAAAAPAAE
jgi:putative membrane protein